MTNPKEQVRERFKEDIGQMIQHRIYHYNLQSYLDSGKEPNDNERDACLRAADFEVDRIADWWLKEIDTLLHSDREAVMESSKKISYIYPDFDRNGLVRETADKINEIIDAVNLLSPNK